MKKLILTAIAASIVASPFVATAASAAPYPVRQEVQRERIVRHQPGRTVVVTRNVRYDRAPVFHGRWHRETRVIYRHGHPVRVTYRNHDYR